MEITPQKIAEFMEYILESPCVTEKQAYVDGFGPILYSLCHGDPGYARQWCHYSIGTLDRTAYVQHSLCTFMNFLISA